MSLRSWTVEPVSSKESLDSDGGTCVKNTRTGEEYRYDFASSLVDGIPHPPFIKEKCVHALQKQLSFHPGDIFVCTYSKCGTSLMEQVVLLLQNNGDASKMNPLHKNTYDRNTGVGKIWPEMAVVPHSDTGNANGNGMDKTTNADDKKACMGENKARMSVTEFDSISNRVMKTHAPTSLFLGKDNTIGENDFRLAKGIKVIYVTRNPFDACVSCYYHPKPGVSPESNGCSFAAFAKLWLTKRIEFGGWSNHIAGWRRAYHENLEHAKQTQSSPQILWISYEELVKSPKASVAKVANFMDIDASSDLVDAVVEGCKFEKMKESARKTMENGTDGNISHLRKGKIGDWRNHFTSQLKEEFEEELKKNLPDGLDVVYDIGDGETWRLGSSSNPSASTGIDTTVSWEQAKLIDVKIIGGTVIFYSVLQMILSYVAEFYADDQRDKNGLPAVMNFPIISTVMANVFNGISGGLALMTVIYAWKLITSQLGNHHDGYSKWISSFLSSIVFESIVTSGVMHSIGHRVFGSTLEGNSWVEVISHLGFTLNVILSGIFMLLWIGPKHLPSLCPKWHEVLVSLCAAGLATAFALVWVPFLPDPYDFDYPEETVFSRDLVILLQGKIQPLAEAILLIPTVLILFALRRLWIEVSRTSKDEMISKLERSALRISILAVAIPLSLNWIHFRCHDDLVGFIQSTMNWNHIELITAIRIMFHIPNWIFAIWRIHLLRRLAEEKAGWPSLKIFDVLCPGGDIFPFMMVFLYRASEGMTLSLLPTFFQGGSDETFHLDITDNMWVAVTILSMFAANAVGSIGLGNLMQQKGFHTSFVFVASSFATFMALFMIPHSNVSLLCLRCVAAIIFPGPVMLSRITQLTRHKYNGSLSFVPMVTALIWFNQGFWFGGAISNSSAWSRDWNAFFYSGMILSILAFSMLVAFFVKQKATKKSQESMLLNGTGGTDVELGEGEPRSDSNLPKIMKGDEIQDENENGLLVSNDGSTSTEDEELMDKDTAVISLWREKWASFVNGASFSAHVSLLGIQITKLVDIDLYEYTTIVGSLGSMSTILILLSFGFMSRQKGIVSLLSASAGHILGTAVLSIPSIYSLESKSLAVFIIALSYAVVLISFFVTNLSCEVSLGQKSLQNKRLAGGKEMGMIKSSLSIGKVIGSLLVVFTFRIHPQLPLWILEGVLIASIVMLGLKREQSGVTFGIKDI